MHMRLFRWLNRSSLHVSRAVVEVYQDWCGPCKAVVNTLKKQFFELGERPLKFYMASAEDHDSSHSTLRCFKLHSMLSAG